MNELENDQTVPPEPEGESTPPLSPYKMSGEESPEEPLPEWEPPPPPAKVKAVEEPFFTRKWWMLFGIGLAGFFVLTTLLWFIMKDGAYCNWLLVSLIILGLAAVNKLYAVLFGYISGYILNFFLAIVLQSFGNSACGEPFYMQMIQ